MNSHLFSQNQNSDFLGTTPIRPLLLRLAIPGMISSFINCLYNVVDRLYIGHSIGTDGMAGLSLTFPYMMILASFGMMIGMGSGAVISIFLGEQKKDQANKVLGQAFAMFLLFLCTFQTLGILFLDKTLRLFGGTEQAIPYARDYLLIILIGNLFQHISFGGSNIIRAEGGAVVAMKVIALGAITNIILDPIFIFGLKMGIRGAAWATNLSMLVSSSWVVLHFRTKSSLRLSLRYIRIYPKLFLRVISIGISPCLMQILHCCVVILYNHTFLRYASSPEVANQGIAVFGIIMPVLMLMMMPIFGINTGVQPILGYNTGARLFLRVRQALQFSLRLGTLLCSLCSLILILGASYIIRCFTSEPALIQVGTYAIRLAAVGFWMVGISMLTSTYFQSTGKAAKAILISILRQGVILVPALLLLPRFFGFNGIWMAAPVGDISCGIFCLILTSREKRLLKEMQLTENHLQTSVVP